MAEQETALKPICAAEGCGTILSRYNPDDLCAACRRRADEEAPTAPDPRDDITTYIEHVANALIEHRGRLHLEPIVGGDPTVLYEAVECLRRLGWHIEGDKTPPGGYMLTGWKRPQRWLRLDSVYRSYMEPPLPLDVEP